uniref:Immunoglobulin domain-containing protein n=1 Tax=Chrysemys picta bellii TaxID=8478 RepID=A0A8C3FQY4_CHRPI
MQDEMLGVQLFLYQTQRILFVEVNGTAKIYCSSKEKMEGGDVFWYLRREGETPTCIKYCLDNLNVSKFACKHETHLSILEISNIQKNETGVYYCAFIYSSYLLFGNGTTLIVGGKEPQLKSWMWWHHDPLCSSQAFLSGFFASSTAPASECSHYIVPLAAGAGLLLLVVSLSLVWTLCPSTLGNKHSPAQTLSRREKSYSPACNCPVQHMNMLQMSQLPALISECLFSET